MNVNKEVQKLNKEKNFLLQRLRELSDILGQAKASNSSNENISLMFLQKANIKQYLMIVDRRIKILRR